MSSEHKPPGAAEIEKLRELEAKATPGEWVADLDGHESSIRRCDDDCLFAIDLQEDDAALIAAMRNALPRLLSMLQPPADAAVREAVEGLSAGVGGPWEGVGTMFDDIRTLLSYVRAAQAQQRR